MDAVEITCMIADKLGHSRYWENRISKGVYESGEYSDNEYAEKTCALRTKIMEDGYASSFSVPVLEIVQMVLAIQQDQRDKSTYREEPMATQEYVERIKKIYDQP